jgi:hypothetical protein
MADIEELARTYLPKYLTPKQQNELWAELRDFPSIGSFYLPPDATSEQALQGDGWRGLVVVRFETGEQRSVTGLILSNSCDIAPENQRALPTNVVFAPLVALDRYVDRLIAAGQTTEQVASLLDTIRRQEVTSLFYLPALSYGPPESVAFLDDVHSHPAPHFFGTTRARVFRLSMVAFWVLLLKLSIHFCRFQEGVPRFAA